MVSYTRAAPEALIGSCKVGFHGAPRAHRALILGALFERWGAMAPALWVLAIMTTITVIHRIRYTYLETERRKLELSPSLMPSQTHHQTPQPILLIQTAAPGPCPTTP